MARANGIPGETLPRWTFSLYWRKDGKPLWSDAGLLASETSDTGARVQDAEKLMTAVADVLGVEADVRRRRLRRYRRVAAQGG